MGAQARSARVISEGIRTLLLRNAQAPPSAASRRCPVGPERHRAPRGGGRRDALPPFGGSPSYDRKQRTCPKHESDGSVVDFRQWWSVVAAPQVARGIARRNSRGGEMCKLTRRSGEFQTVFALDMA